VLFDLEAALQSRDPSLARWRRLEAEGALLLFLRAHPEVMRVEALGSGGRPLLEAARRGGVPVLWMASEEAGGGAAGAGAGGTAGAAPPRRAIDPIETPIEGRFAPRLGTRSVRGAVTVEATIDAARFLFPGGTATPGRTCVLADAQGRRIAGDAPAVSAAVPAGSAAAPAAAKGATAAGAMGAAATLDADGWSVPSPWSLTCSETAGSTLTMFEPLAARYRTTLLLNLAAMSLAVVLGGVAIHQARRRRDIEALAEEEARVRELERRLFHAERLSTVGRLAAGMAHEINNPLEGMANYLALLRSDLERGDRESARRRLEGVHEGLRRAEAVVHLVLAHSDPARAPMGEVDVAATLRQAAEFVRSRREFAKVSFDFDLPALPHVQGRQTLLGQLFLNIVLNACEAQPQGGEVRIAAHVAEDAVVVTIADRGPGIAAAESGRVFEPFYSTKGSTGLGLSTCYAIVEQHRGAIEAAPRAGGGAVFTIRLPMTRAGAGASDVAGGAQAARAEGVRG
jgi:signal transduction histidine kinase